MLLPVPMRLRKRGGKEMIRFAAEEYQECKKWIAQKIQAGYSWADVKKLCTTDEMFEEEFYRLQDDEMIIPPTMNPEDWAALVCEQEENHIPIVDMFGGISAEGATNTLSVPMGGASAWNNYKNHLLGRTDGKPKMSEEAVTLVEKNCHWLLNHMKRETRDVGPVKGLVMGSVQSGKTANMIGLVSMAADYDWNFFIIMSGSIDNLRKQTRDRFCADLMQSQGVNWRVLDYTSNPDYLIDIKTQEKYTECDLKLNNLGNNTWGYRYVTVCLKNSTRLERLINWLHSDPVRAAKLRILIIDDEADQAGINTAKMSEYLTEEDIIERTAINQYLVNLANGKNANGTETNAPFQAMNYISFTATPYANVLNEAFEESLYPKDFICSLPESNEYFGAKVIFSQEEPDTQTRAVGGVSRPYFVLPRYYSGSRIVGGWGPNGSIFLTNRPYVSGKHTSSLNYKNSRLLEFDATDKHSFTAEWVNSVGILSLFAYNENNNMRFIGGMCIYDAVFTMQASVIGHYIPVINSQGIPCMYDLVTKQLFPNSGTGYFVVGFETTDKAALGLSKLPIVQAGELTVSLPAAAQDDATFVPAAIEVAKQRGWTIITQYRED